MSEPGELIVDRLVKHAAAYFSTIRARKSAPDLDPFLASLMEDAIRAKAGLGPREAAPAPVVNGANGVPGVLAVLKAGDPEGMLYSEIRRSGSFTSKTTVTRGLAKLIAAGAVFPKNARGRYRLTGNEPTVALDGRSVAERPSASKDGTTRDRLKALGIRQPGKVLIAMTDLLVAHPEVVYSPDDVKKVLGLTASGGATVSRPMTKLIQIGIARKVGTGRYQRAA